MITMKLCFDETVWAAKEFIEREIKNTTWEKFEKSQLNKSIKLNRPNFDKAKKPNGEGIGQTVILSFLGENWKQWMIQEALSTI